MHLCTTRKHGRRKDEADGLLRDGPVTPEMGHVGVFSISVIAYVVFDGVRPPSPFPRWIILK